MKSIKLVLYFIFIIEFAHSQTGKDILTNEDIISLCNSGISSTLILTKIKMSESKFDLSTEGLINLKNNHVPDEILNVMINPNYKEDEAVIQGDINFLYKKWELIDLVVDGISTERQMKTIVEYRKDGTYLITNTLLNSHETFHFEFNYELSEKADEIILYMKNGTKYYEKIISLSEHEMKLKGNYEGEEQLSILKAAN